MIISLPDLVCTSCKNHLMIEWANDETLEARCLHCEEVYLLPVSELEFKCPPVVVTQESDGKIT